MDKKVKLFLVRHGESVANTEGIYQGQTYDTDLSILGKKQVKALARVVKKLGIKKIISSPLKRTYQTALAVSKETGVPVEKNIFIIETNHGKWEGNNKDWIKENFGKIYEIWLNNPSKARFPEGETFLQTTKRFKKFITGSIPSNTLVVTHDNIVRIAAVMANGKNFDNIWKFNIEPAAINVFELNKTNGKKEIKTLKLNDNRHLKGLKTDLSKHAL